MRTIAKIVVTGDTGVGKTTLIHRVIHNEFIEKIRRKIGVGYQNYEIKTENQSIHTQIWDFGGEGIYKEKRIFDKYFKGATVTIIMFDLTNYETFNSLQYWIESSKRNCKAKIILVGGKKDLVKKPIIDKKNVETIQKENNISHSYHEVSSKTGENIEKLIKDVVGMIVGE